MSVGCLANRLVFVCWECDVYQGVWVVLCGLMMMCSRMLVVLPQGEGVLWGPQEKLKQKCYKQVPLHRSPPQVLLLLR